MFSGKKPERDIVQEFANFVNSPEFDAYIYKVGMGEVDDQVVENLAKTPAFKKYAERLKVPAQEFLKNIARPVTRLPETQETQETE